MVSASNPTAAGRRAAIPSSRTCGDDAFQELALVRGVRDGLCPSGWATVSKFWICIWKATGQQYFEKNCSTVQETAGIGAGTAVFVSADRRGSDLDEAAGLNWRDNSATNVVQSLPPRCGADIGTEDLQSHEGEEDSGTCLLSPGAT